MTTRYCLALAGFLLAGSVPFPVPAIGQDRDGATPANNPVFPAGSAFTVRDARDITTFEQLMIVTRKALAPLAPADVTPLHAYDGKLACGDDQLLRQFSPRDSRYGPAALVAAYDTNREAEAWYFPTPYEAISAARLIGWCDAGQDDAGQRYFATTYPIDEDVEGFGEPERRFMSMEADLVAGYIRELEQPESDAALAQETAVWESMRDSNDPADFEGYLVWRPNGAFAPVARIRLEALRSEEGVFWESIRDGSDPADFVAYLDWRPNGTFAPLAWNRLEALLAGIADARRIVVQGGARAAAMPADEIADRITSALGSDVTVRSLGESTFVAESRTGFSAESLSRLLVELGPDTRLYRDDPVSPGAVR